MSLGNTRIGGPRKTLLQEAGAKGPKRGSAGPSRTILSASGARAEMNRRLEAFCRQKGINAQEILPLTPKSMDPTGWLKASLPSAEKIRQFVPGTSLTEAITLFSEYRQHWAWLKKIFSNIELTKSESTVTSVWNVWHAAIYQRYIAFESIHRNDRTMVRDPQLLKEYELHGPWLLQLYQAACMDASRRAAQAKKHIPTRETFEALIDAKHKIFQTMDELGMTCLNDPEK